MATLKESLTGALPEKELALVPSSYDTVGDLAIFSEFPPELKKKEKLIGGALLGMHKNLNVVLKKVGTYSGKFRTPKLKVIAGEDRKETMHVEHGCRFRVNPEKAYFSARLGGERKRIAIQVKKHESVLVLFSGIGAYPIVIAKIAQPQEIVSVELNPYAAKYHQENLRLNKVFHISLIKGDVVNVLPKLKKKFDRIVMPLPKGGERFLKDALQCSKKGTVVHFYTFSREDALGKLGKEIIEMCKKTKVNAKILDVVPCGHFGPGIVRACVDFQRI
ncbi:class I SAM-dependent methyltransferase family protein [Candidatus Woesearchaeota archaeon]|nr:class I SAM-dependent methyltransferase family protein [Candidatus Woesearchaeota archaeon]